MLESVMSMMAEFFDITKQSGDLFNGLKISENRSLCDAWMNQYPIIFFSLKQVGGSTFDSAMESMASLLETYVLQHSYLTERPHLRPRDKKLIFRGNPAEILLTTADHSHSRPSWTSPRPGGLRPVPWLAVRRNRTACP